MNNIALIALIFLGFNFLFLAIKVFVYVRGQWRIVDREMKEEMERQREADRRMEGIDHLLTEIFINENDNKETSGKVDQA